jgi:hypothetical protein
LRAKKYEIRQDWGICISEESITLLLFHGGTRMTHLIVKLRMHDRGNKYRKILSFENEEIYVLPSGLDTAIAYDPKYILDENEWFFIENFSSKDYHGDLVGNNFNSVDYDTLKKEMFSSIAFLCSYQNGDYYFQNIPKSKLVRKKSVFHFGEDYRYNDKLSALFINELPDALYRSVNKTLYFRRLSAITSIFNGIDQLYREATKNETEQFLNLSFITLAGNFCSSNVGKRNRQRIALALDTLGKLEETEKESLMRYIKEYYPKLITDTGLCTINSEDDLKLLLFGIEQQYYTTQIGEEKRQANSVIPLKKLPQAGQGAAP